MNKREESDMRSEYTHANDNSKTENVIELMKSMRENCDDSDETLFDIVSTPTNDQEYAIYKNYTLDSNNNNNINNNKRFDISNKGSELTHVNDTSELFKFSSNEIFNEKNIFGPPEMIVASEEHAPVMETNYLEYIANSDPRVSFEMLHLGALLAIEKKEKIERTNDTDLPRWNLPEVIITNSNLQELCSEQYSSFALPISPNSSNEHLNHKIAQLENSKHEQSSINKEQSSGYEKLSHINEKHNGCFVVPSVQAIISNRTPVQREEIVIDNLLTNPPRHVLARAIGANLLAVLKRNTTHPLQSVVSAHRYSTSRSHRKRTRS